MCQWVVSGPCTPRVPTNTRASSTGPFTRSLSCRYITTLNSLSLLDSRTLNPIAHHRLFSPLQLHASRSSFTPLLSSPLTAPRLFTQWPHIRLVFLLSCLNTAPLLCSLLWIDHMRGNVGPASRHRCLTRSPYRYIKKPTSELPSSISSLTTITTRFPSPPRSHSILRSRSA